MRSLILLIIFISIHLLHSELLPGYYIGSKGDTVFGKIQVHYSPDFADSVAYYDLQYNVLFANNDGKVLLIRPTRAIREIAIWNNGKWNKMICVKRKETVGNLKVRRTEFIFLYRGIHGPIDVYCVVMKRIWGWMDYEADLCFYRRKTGVHVRETFHVSDTQFAELVSGCPEATEYLNSNGIYTQYQMLKLTEQFNKYCPE